MMQSEQKSNYFSPNPSDIYLQPHSDDICFSLGAFAHKQHCGILLTVFSVSGFALIGPGGTRPSVDWVTKIRNAEDSTFAEACGLKTRFLGLRDALLFGPQVFDGRLIKLNLQRVKSPLLDSLLSAPVAKNSARPWLFCPSGIGGHIDHVAIRMLVNQNYNHLSPRYRIGFYEDLHYASSAAARAAGIKNLLQETQGRQLHRYVFPLREDVSKKIALIQLYRSQFSALPNSIEQFTPAAKFPSSPHEAFWSNEPTVPV